MNILDEKGDMGSRRKQIDNAAMRSARLLRSV